MPARSNAKKTLAAKGVFCFVEVTIKSAEGLIDKKAYQILQQTDTQVLFVPKLQSALARLTKFLNYKKQI